MRTPPLLLTLALAGFLPGAEPLGLPRALRLAGEHSQAAEAARASLAGAHEETAQVRGLYWPEVQIQGGYWTTDHRPELVSQPMRIGPLTVPPQVFPTSDSQAWRYRASVQYLLWDFGRRGEALSASRAREEAVARSGGADLLKAQSEVAARYFALLNLKAQMRVLVQRREALELHLGHARALFEQGVVARNDLLRTEVALRAVGDAEQALGQAYASTLEGLNVAMGLRPDTAQDLPETLAGPPELPWNEPACRARARQRNEAVQAARARARALADQATYRRKDLLPTLAAEASHTYGQNSFLTHEHETSLFVGLSWKLFDGGIRTARVRQADAETGRARRDLQEAERQAETAAAAALRAFRQSLREVDTARLNVASAEENLRMVGDQYQEGLVRNTDVLDAESVLAESRSALEDRRYRAYAQQTALLAVLGEDLPAFFEAHAPRER
ncbi:TolC family protein [Geothrix oryzisoli]|uniref:TolC family protein n=1 Tax=Geothrix oryzisoli TaxID=2922721 RepID=UPI001FAC231B|nr:TolC family protein [Geothrix oryzisoli]